MIGYYNPSVILTYIGLASSVCAIAKAAQGDIRTALLLLMASGVCDMFDGTIARMVKRNENEKQFGIQIDSLCDMICFGACPAAIAFFAAEADGIRIALMCLYVLCGVIRLAFFNVMALDSPVEIYRGLPITSGAAIFPFGLTLAKLMGWNMGITADILLGVTAILFIADFPLTKPKKKGKTVIVICGVVLLAFVLKFSTLF